MNAARAQRRQQLAEAEELLGGFDNFVMAVLGLSMPAVVERPTFAIRQQDIGNRLDAFFHSPHFIPTTQVLSATKTAAIDEIAQFSRDVWRPEGHLEATFRYVEISSVNPHSGEAGWQVTPTAEAPSRARMAVQPGDLLVSLTRPHHGSIALLPGGFPESVASTGFAVLRDFSPLVVPDYVWAVLRTKLGLQQMMQRSSGGNYPAITEVELAKVRVPLPDLATQQYIADEVRKRQQDARTLREAAETGWAAAKAAFEARLLGS